MLQAQAIAQYGQAVGMILNCLAIALQRHPFVISFVFIPLLTGCGTSTGDVTGQVFVKGKALKSGRVRFVSADGASKYVRDINRDGWYEIKNLPPGKWKVAVLISPLPAPAHVKNISARPEFPPKYGDPDLSKLTCVIRANETTTYNIELTW